ERRALRFAEGTWSIIDPRVCKLDYHQTRDILPMPDGSIATLCDGNRLWFYWPDGFSAADQKLLQGLIDELSAGDPAVRESASRELIKRGAQFGEALRKIKGDDLPPEARVRLQYIVKTLGLIDAPNHDGVGLQ